MSLGCSGSSDAMTVSMTASVRLPEWVTHRLCASRSLLSLHKAPSVTTVCRRRATLRSMSSRSLYKVTSSFRAVFNVLRYVMSFIIFYFIQMTKSRQAQSAISADEGSGATNPDVERSDRPRGCRRSMSALAATSMSTEHDRVQQAPTPRSLLIFAFYSHIVAHAPTGSPGSGPRRLETPCFLLRNVSARFSTT